MIDPNKVYCNPGMPVTAIPRVLTEEYLYNLGLRPCRKLIGEGEEMREGTTS